MAMYRQGWGNYMSCPTCDEQFVDRQGNKAALREKLARNRQGWGRQGGTSRAAGAG